MTPGNSRARVSVVLPTYNEAENIVPLIAAIKASCNAYRPEILVVDDDSPDRTAQIVQKAIRTFRWTDVRVIKRTADHGLTASYREGFREAKGDIVCIMDCDFSHPPEVLPKLIAGVQNGADMAIASRFVRGGKMKPPGDGDSAVAVLGSKLLNLTLRILFGSTLTDYTSGFAAIRRPVLSCIDLSGDYGEYFYWLAVWAGRLGFRISEVPYASVARRAGVSKTAPTLGKLMKRATGYFRQALRLLSDPAPQYPPTGTGKPEIRLFCPSDSAACAVLHATRIPGPAKFMGIGYTQKLWMQIAEHPDSYVCTVAETGGRICGFSAATTDFSAHSRFTGNLMTINTSFRMAAAIACGKINIRIFPDHTHIGRMIQNLPHAAGILAVAVSEDRTGKGIGSRLLDALIASLRSRGIRSVVVDTLLVNPAARALYTSAGFRTIRTFSSSILLIKERI